MGLQFLTIGSGSRGNCYVLDNGQTQIMLDCGLPIQQIKKAMGFDLTRLEICLVTHGHQDHIKSASALMEHGIPVCMSRECAETAYVNSVSTPLLRKFALPDSGYMHIQYFGAPEYIIVPFKAVHDSPGTVGYGVMMRGGVGEPEWYRTAYLTDSGYSPVVLPFLDHLFVECNHDEESMGDSLRTGEITDSHRLRVLQNHFSLDRCIEFALACKERSVGQLRRIILLHASAQNANVRKMVSEMQGATGIPTEVAAAGKAVLLA